MNLITTATLVVLLAIAATTTPTNADQWNWLNDGETFMEDLVREKRQDAVQNATEVEDNDILNYILDSGRQGRSLEGFDEIYSDPSVQQALQNSDDAEARNVIKEKLCALGLMQCDGELVDGRRPYLNPQNLIYAQPVALKPVGRPIATIPVRGPPGPPPQQGPIYRPPPPPQQKPHQGPYGPPQPMPFPGNPQQKVGYASQQSSFNGPNSFSGASYSGSYPPYLSKPPGPIYEGSDIPYEFESPNGKPPPGVIIADGPPSVGKAPVEQHIHHHYHHIEGGNAEKTVIVNKPVPLTSDIITGSSVGGSSSSSNNFYQSGSYGTSGSSSLGGFNPSNGKDFDYQDLKGANNQQNFGGQYGNYASQSKPQSSSFYNQGPATFGSSENTIYGTNSAVVTGSYQTQEGFHSSNPNLYKKELNVKGPANGLTNYATSDYSKYSNQYNGQYSNQQFNQNQNKYSQNGNYQNSGFNQNSAFNQNAGFNQRGDDCVCVPYEQCPAQDVVGRRDDLILPLDPRNLKSDIQAEIEKVVITDGNGTMTVVHVPKNSTAQARSDNATEPGKKISKREAAAEKKSDDDKANVEPRLLGGGGGHHGEGGGKKVVPTFGVSFGLPYPSYPLNPYGPNPAGNPYFGSIGANGLNLGLLNVNPLFSFQVTKDEYGDKILKPLVNLHVTPTENIVHKVGNLLAAKKQNILHVFNQHDHYHNHVGYPPPPAIYRPPHGPPFSHGPPPPHFGPTGPNLIFTKPPGPVYTGPGPIYSGPPGPPGPIYSGPPGPIYNRPPTGPFGPPGPIYGSRPPFFRDASSASNDELDYDPSDIGRTANVTFDQRQQPPIGNFQYQAVYPQNQPDSLNQNRVDYARQYQNYQNSNIRLPPPTQNIPTPAPGHSEGSSIVSFPRSRRSTDVSVPDSLEPLVTDAKEASSEQVIVQEKSVQAEKRQAYYGPRPQQQQQQQQQQCSRGNVCCRRPVYRPQGPSHANLGKCGVRNAQGINGRIKNPVYIDGDSEFGEYPWQVAILKKDPKESVYVCGGTLIDNQYIITAAHCVKTYNGFDLRVRLGEWDVNHDVEFYPYIERDVIAVQIHPEYYAGTLDNDLAILKMDQPVDFSNTPHISPACLPDKYTDFSGQRCWTTGWGKDAFGDYGKYQNILKEVDVPIVNEHQCQNQLRQTRLGYSYKLHPGFLCAGGEEGKDACKGDGGGPLVCDRNGSWQVVGIVSWGIGCGKANVPGVYVKVAYYLDWINQVRGRF